MVRFGQLGRGDAHLCAGCTELLWAPVAILVDPSRLRPELASFAGTGVSAPELGRRGMVWVVLWGVALGC